MSVVNFSDFKANHAPSEKELSISTIFNQYRNLNDVETAYAIIKDYRTRYDTTHDDTVTNVEFMHDHLCSIIHPGIKHAVESNTSIEAYYFDVLDELFKSIHPYGRIKDDNGPRSFTAYDPHVTDVVVRVTKYFVSHIINAHVRLMYPHLMSVRFFYHSTITNAELFNNVDRINEGEKQYDIPMSLVFTNMNRTLNAAHIMNDTKYLNGLQYILNVFSNLDSSCDIIENFFFDLIVECFHDKEIVERYGFVHTGDMNEEFFPIDIFYHLKKVALEQDEDGTYKRTQEFISQHRRSLYVAFDRYFLMMRLCGLCALDLRDEHNSSLEYSLKPSTMRFLNDISM